MMKKFKVSMYTVIEAADQEQAQEKANAINIYFNLANGGNELDPSVTRVEPYTSGNDMSTDEVVDYFTQEFATAYLKLENALDQADVTEAQLLRIKDVISVLDDKLKTYHQSLLNKSKA